MPSILSKPVGDLKLDLSNFRVPTQATEAAALKAMVASDSKKFWALMESLLDSGFLPTENIVVLKSGSDLVVKEGNRRIAALKLAAGQLRSTGIFVPEAIQSKIKTISVERMVELTTVPCAIFGKDEAEAVGNIVSLTHGKGEAASRTPWNAVATARHNRDHTGGVESGLDLLESYLKNGRDLSQDEKAQWGGDYPLSLLDEVIQKLTKRLELGKTSQFVALYPNKFKPTQRKNLESLLHDIGTKELTFPRLRSELRDALKDYGFSSAVQVKPSSDYNDTPNIVDGNTNKPAEPSRDKPENPEIKPTEAKPIKPKAISTNDPRSVRKKLREMDIRGKGREKVQTLREEAVSLDIPKTPLAFCFILRSMFELSAKAYCKDHASSGLSTTKDGKDRKLVEVLRDVVKHIISNVPASEQNEVKKNLHGATAELAAHDRLLSVTSMNQLVHSTHFSVSSNDICILFHNVYPLLESMNT